MPLQKTVETARSPILWGVLPQPLVSHGSRKQHRPDLRSSYRRLISYWGYVTGASLLIQESEDWFNPLADTGASPSPLTGLIESALRRLEDIRVMIEDSRSVCSYLFEYPDMIDAIEQIARVARENFEEDQLVLRLYVDPEIDDEYLVLYVRAREYQPPIIERIRAVRRQCRDFLSGKKGWLLVTTDFRPVE